jgi:hypothetical protein
MREWLIQNFKEVNFRARTTKEEQQTLIIESQEKLDKTVKDVFAKSELLK